MVGHFSNRGTAVWRKEKGADTGIDGIIYFRSDKNTTERAIVSVKGGEHVGVSMIRDLKGVMARERAPIEEALKGKKPDIPLVDIHAAFKKTDREEASQERLI